MRLYSKEECEDWLKGRERQLPDKVGAVVHRLGYPTEPHRVFGIAHWIASNLCYREPALLWISEWGIWPSTENWHLYYRLRQSYGDHRLLHEAPGHLFMNYELEDLATMLEVAMLNGWGGYVLTQANYVNVFFSHDEYVDFLAKDEVLLAEVRKWTAEI
jgi:hypothetical protein